MIRPIRYSYGWRVNTIRAGKRIQVKFPDRRYQDAHRAATDFIANLQAGAGVSDTSTIPQLVEHYIRVAERTGQKAPVTAKNDLSRLNLFVSWCRKRGLRFVSEITADRLLKYKDWWFDGYPHYGYKTDRAKWLPNNTWEKHRISLQGFFHFCVDRGVITHNPVKNLKGLMTKRSDTPARWYTEKEIDALLAWIDAQAGIFEQVWFRLLIYTGLRRGEALALRWRNVRLDSGLIVLEKTKSGRPQSVPIAKELQEWILKLPQGSSNRLVFARPDGSPYRSGNSWYVLFREALDACGLPPAGLHSLRHSLGVHLAASGENQRLIQEIFRHSSGRMTERYTQIAVSQLRPTVDRLHFGKKSSVKR